jgi:hypothetical protein
MPEFPFNCSIELARDLLSRTSDLLTKQDLEKHIIQLGNRMRDEPVQLATHRVLGVPRGTTRP